MKIPAFLLYNYICENILENLEMSDRRCGHFGSQRGRQYVMTPKFVGSWIYLYTMNWKLTMVTGITAYKLEVII